MKTSFKAVRAALVAVFVFVVGFAAEAQRVRLLQLERYLGQPIPNRAGYVGLTDTLGDQYYHKLDSIIGYIADSISQGLDTDEQYFDTAMIVNDTLILSIIRDGLPAHRISLTAYTSDDQTLSYDHANNTLSISGGNSVTNFEQAWMRQADLLHPISNGESILRSGYTTLGYNGSSVPLSFDSVQLRVWNESRIDWLGFTTSKPSVGQHRRIEINELANVLYLANKRFYATDDGADLFTNGTLFNGEFGGPYFLTSSSTRVIEIDFTQGLEKLTSAGITYPQGNVYVSFYYVYNDATITVEAVTTGGTFNLSSTEKNIAISSWAGYKVLRYTIPQINYLTKLRFTFNTGAGLCWPTELSYVMSNYANEIEEPFVNKAVDNKLHTKLTFRDKVGDRQNDNGTLGQILMSKVDSVEWADFTSIPGIYTYITNIADSVDTDTDTDEQTIDSFAITDDTLRISLSNDPDIFNVSLKQYIDTAFGMYDTDSQSVNQFYLDGLDSLHIEITRGNHQSVYLGSLVPSTGSDKQRIDTFDIVDDTLRISLQRDSVNFSFVDLNPYLDNTDDQKIDVFTFVGTTLSVSNEDDGEASKTVDLSGLVDNWLLNGLDDAFGSTDIGDAETVTFAGTGGITAKLSFDGSNTMVIDGMGLQWILQAQAGTSQVIGDAASEIVEIVGAGNASTSISGNTVTITVPADVDNYVDGATYSGATADLTLTRTGALGDLVVNIMDHDWYEVGTTRPPDAITDEMFHTGKTGIGMNPIWLLDVAEDARIYGHQVGRGGGNSITNLRLGVDALSSNTTGEGNLAIGPYALLSNTTSNINLAIGYEALRNNNETWNTAIGIYSMKNCTTCLDNTAVGLESMEYAINAHYNTAVGHGSIRGNKYGHGNTAVGDYTILDDTLAYYNTALGRFAMRYPTLTRGNIAIGYESLNITNNSGSEYNTVMGFQSMYGALNVSDNNLYNIAIGYQALYEPVTTMSYNIGMGRKAGSFLNGNMNIAIGDSTLYTSSVDYNIILGAYNTSTADSNVIIGYNQSLSTNGNLLLTNGTGSQFIRMLNTGYVGLGVATPTQKLHVPGNVRVTGAYYDSNNEPGTAGQVLSSLATGTDWVDATSGGTMSYFFINGNDDAFGNTQVDQGEVITIDGTGGITASLAASGSLSYVIDGSGITGTTSLAITNSTNPGLTSSNGSDVIFQDGTGIDAVYVNDFTIRFNATDASITNEIQSLSFGYGSGQSAITISDDPSTLYMYAGNGITFSGQTGTTMTINAADVSNINEGRLGVGTGGPTSSTIITNTTGSNAVTINVAGTLSIAESANSNGGSITITGTGGAGTVTSVGLTGTTGIGVGGTNPITGAGTFTLSLNNDLAALEGMSTSGFAVRNGGAWLTRTIGAGPGVTVSNGDGVGANPSIGVEVVDVVAGNNISVSQVGGVHTVAQPAFTSLTTGLTANTILFVGSDGTPASENDLVYNSASSILQYTGTLTVIGGLSASSNSLFSGAFSTSSTVTMANIPTYADDAAAGGGGLTTGRLYKTSVGDLRIKL